MDSEYDVGPFTLPDGMGRLSLLVTLVLLVIVALAVTVVVTELRREVGHRSLWRIGLAAVCGAGAVFVWWSFHQPVTFLRDGTTFECAYGDPVFAIAQLRGDPDDSVLAAHQRDCRTHAQTLLRVQAATATLLVVGLVGAAGSTLLRRRRRPVTT